MRRPTDGGWMTNKTAGVMIGGFYSGDPSPVKSTNNTVERCVFKDVRNAVYIWHSTGNNVVNNRFDTASDGGEIATYGEYDERVIAGENLAENTSRDPAEVRADGG